jgi:hypothetical protein
LNLLIVKQGDAEVPGLTDTEVARLRSPRRRRFNVSSPRSSSSASTRARRRRKLSKPSPRRKPRNTTRSLPSASENNASAEANPSPSAVRPPSRRRRRLRQRFLLVKWMGFGDLVYSETEIDRDAGDASRNKA